VDNTTRPTRSKPLPLRNIIVHNEKRHTGVLISPYLDPNKKTIERSPFFVRRGGHCCREDQVGRATLWIFFWVACKS